MKGILYRLWCELLLHKALIGFAVLALGLGFALIKIEQQARTNHRVLCALEEDVRKRRDANQTYLDAHPRGVVSPKTNAVIITPAQLQQSIDNQTSTLEALDRGGLHCG